jgi:hypothetical protein
VDFDPPAATGGSDDDATVSAGAAKTALEAAMFVSKGHLHSGLFNRQKKLSVPGRALRPTQPNHFIFFAQVPLAAL